MPNRRAAGYEGTKEEFPNYALYAFDGDRRPVRGEIRGQQEPERGLLLQAASDGAEDPPTGGRGWRASPGEYGMIALGDGLFYLGETGESERDGVTLSTGAAELYRWKGDDDSREPFGRVS